MVSEYKSLLLQILDHGLRIQVTVIQILDHGLTIQVTVIQILDHGLRIQVTVITNFRSWSQNTSHCYYKHLSNFKLS